MLSAFLHLNCKPLKQAFLNPYMIKAISTWKPSDDIKYYNKCCDSDFIESSKKDSEIMSKEKCEDEMNPMYESLQTSLENSKIESSKFESLSSIILSSVNRHYYYGLIKASGLLMKKKLTTDAHWKESLCQIYASENMAIFYGPDTIYVNG